MNEPWLSFYPKNMPAEIEIGEQTLQDVLLEAERQYADKVGFVCMGKEMTFADLFDRARAFANYCREALQLKAGDRLALMMPNLLQYLICLFGALLAGLTVVNLNPLDKAESLKNELSDSAAKAIVVLENFTPELEKIIDQTAVSQVILTSVGSQHPALERWLINSYLRYIKRVIPTWHPKGAIRFHKALELGRSHQFKLVKVKSEDLAFLQYTAGTTGLPKGVMLSHKNIVANLLQIYTWTKKELHPGKETVLTALPLYHIFSLVINCFLFAFLGGRSILVPDPRNIPSLVSIMKKSKVSCFCGVNTLFNELLHNEAFRKMEHDISVVIGGGMGVQQAVAEEWQKVTGSVLIQGYGLTEASPVVTINPLDAKKFTGSIGQPIPSTKVSIRDDQTGKEMPIGEVGDLCVQGPQVMQGYFHRDTETAETLRDGWLHTDDAAYMDEKGFVYIVNRIKDMVLVSGFNVYPAEVENMIKTMSGVNEVAAIGVPDATHGEVVKVFIVLEQGVSLTEKAVIKFCHDKLAAYKCPHHVEFVDALPKSPVGKILKKDLRAQQQPVK